MSETRIQGVPALLLAHSDRDASILLALGI